MYPAMAAATPSNGSFSDEHRRSREGERMTSTTRRSVRTAVLGLLAVGGLLGVGMTAPANATASGAEGKIAFVRANQIYTMTKTGGSVTALTTSAKNYRPKWSPDGKHIAFIHETAAGVRDVYEMTATGAQKTQVTHDGGVTQAPAWSPDSQRLAYGGGDNTVYLIKATAPFGNPTQLQVFPQFGGDTGPMEVEQGIAWSPDGENLAVLNNNSEDSPDRGMHMVRTMNGPNPHEEDVINATGGSCCGEMDWADLAFGPNGDFGYGQIDPGDEFQFNPPHIRIIYPGFVSKQGDRAPAPSPSGAHMAFVVRTAADVPNIWTATITGGQRTMIKANAYQPDWQPLP
jgi:dipeptidyl aminopeptidase/acylaminoacyl peptidase